MRWRVVWGLAEVMLRCSPRSAFSKLDLPTLGRPTMATVPKRWGLESGVLRDAFKGVFKGVIKGVIKGVFKCVFKGLSVCVNDA